MRKLRIGNKVLTKIDYEKLEREEKERARRKEEKEVLEKSIIDSYFRDLERYTRPSNIISYNDPILDHIPDNIPVSTNSYIVSSNNRDIYAVGTTNTYFSPRLRKNVDED